MSQEYILNRLRITGKLNDRTPHYVISEIIRSHNICIYNPIENIEQLLKNIKMIECYRCSTIREPFSNRDLRLLATYVNMDYNTWTKSSLIKSYNHMHELYNSKCDIDLSKVYYGQKTYENIDAYNACMLYNLCNRYAIETQWNMKPETMCFLVKQQLLSLSALKEQLYSSIEQMNKNALINMINKSTEYFSKNELNNTEYIAKETPKYNLPPLISLEVPDLVESLNRYKNSVYLLQQINPKTHYDAVILSALIYNLNLTESKHPFDEYMKLKEVKNLSLYKPVDSTFRKRFICNPDWYNLTLYWEPKLSFIYDENGLKKLCVNEGFDHEDFRGYGFESLLQISRISFNVFLGKNVYSEEEYTSIDLIDLKDLHNTECLTLGNIETKDMKTYTFEELANHFKREKNFSNPDKTKEILEKRIVRKIGMYASKLNHPCMIEAIEIVEKWKSYSTEYTDKLRNIFKHSYTITDIFYKLLECGMYMRGWKVTNDKYPLNEEMSLIVKGSGIENGSDRIEKNVLESIEVVFDRLNQYNDEERKVLENLPLMKMSITNGDVSYIVTPDPDDGASLFERLNIVKNGDKHKNMKSCIRLTSNIILVSVHFYLCSLGIVEPFNIHSLDHIT